KPRSRALVREEDVVGDARAELVGEPGRRVRLVDRARDPERPRREHRRRREVAADAENEVRAVMAEEFTACGDHREEPEREADLREEPSSRVLERRDRLERDAALGDHAALEPSRVAEVDESMA